MNTVNSQYNQLISSIASLEQVQSIGKSGGGELPQAGESDIDNYVFCTAVPSCEIRKSAVGSLDFVTNAKFGEHANEYWGICDFLFIGDTEVCLLYFTMQDMDAKINAVLRGEHLDKQDNYFYPTGRCATIMSMYILCDKHGYIAALKQKLAYYPDELAAKLVAFHLRRLADCEDIERGVSRKDPLFYHFALDLAIDHFLQALFAINRCYFPSRKRSIQYIEGFSNKPHACADRLLNIIALGGRADSIDQSYDELTALSNELAEIIQSSCTHIANVP